MKPEHKALTKEQEFELYRAIVRGERPVEDIEKTGLRLDITTGPMSMSDLGSADDFAPTMLDYAAGFVAYADRPMMEARRWGFVVLGAFHHEALKQSEDGERLIECLWDLCEARPVDPWTLAFSRDLLARFENRTFEEGATAPIVVPRPPEGATLHFKRINHNQDLFECEVKDSSGNVLWSTDEPAKYDDIRWPLVAMGYDRKDILEAVWAADPEQKQAVERAMGRWSAEAGKFFRRDPAD
jgi:hypothetical protein